MLLFYNSDSVPRPTYHPKDYVELVLDKRLGFGATGDTLSTLIEPDMLSHSPKYRPLVFKMATEPEHIEHLTYESKIYAQLEATGVEGIPCSLGIWQDT